MDAQQAGMRASEEMAQRTGRRKVLSTRVDPEQHKRIRTLIAGSGERSMDRFVLDAVMEKLERGGVETAEVGVLRGLAPEDRILVEWLADFLREYPDHPILRDVLSVQRGVLQIVAQA